MELSRPKAVRLSTPEVGDIGGVRKRLMTPVVMSLLGPTAEAVDAVDRLSSRSPASAKSFYEPPPGIGAAEPIT